MNREIIDAYKEIKAPDGLRERVLEAAKDAAVPVSYGKVKQFGTAYRKIAAAAAVFTLTATVVLAVLFMNQPQLTLNGERVSGKSISISQDTEKGIMRTGVFTDSLTLTLDTDAAEKTRITVSAGEIALKQDETAAQKYSDTLDISGETAFVWKLENLTPEMTPELSIKSGIVSENYVLTFVHAEGVWKITKK